MEEYEEEIDLPSQDLLERRANRVRENGRPKNPKTLDFEVFAQDIYYKTNLTIYYQTTPP